MFFKIFADQVPKQNWMLVKRSVTNLKTANTGDNLLTSVQLSDRLFEYPVSKDP